MTSIHQREANLIKEKTYNTEEGKLSLDSRLSTNQGKKLDEEKLKTQENYQFITDLQIINEEIN